MSDCVVQQAIDAIESHLALISELERTLVTQIELYEEEQNIIQHEMQLLKLNAPQHVRVSTYIQDLLIKRRQAKNLLYRVRAFNRSMNTDNILKNMKSVRNSVTKQVEIQATLLQNRGLIESILNGERKKVEALVATTVDPVKEVN